MKYAEYTPQDKTIVIYGDDDKVIHREEHITGLITKGPHVEGTVRVKDAPGIVPWLRRIRAAIMKGPQVER